MFGLLYFYRMKRVLVLLLGFCFLLNGCSILSKVYVRNYYEHEITLSVENLWTKEKVKTSTKTWAYYTPYIIEINSSTYKELKDSLEMSYDANGTLAIKIPAKSTVLLEMMGNAAPAQNINITVSGKPKKTEAEQVLAKYSIKDVKRQRFHKYCLDIIP